MSTSNDISKLLNIQDKNILFQDNCVKSININGINTTLVTASIEGSINLIKVIKPVVFGYKSFIHFKIRILFISNSILNLI